MKTEHEPTDLHLQKGYQEAEHKRAIEALRESEERLALALSSAGMGAFEWRAQGRGVTWSKMSDLETTRREFSNRYCNNLNSVAVRFTRPPWRRTS